MPYSSPQSLRSRAASLGAVAVLHGVIAVVLVSGLAYTSILHDHPRTTTFDVPQTPPPPEPPHTTPKTTPSSQPKLQPAYTPPTQVDITRQQTIEVTTQPTPFDATPTPRADPTASTPPAQPSFTPKAATPRGRPADWATPDDYPAQDFRLEHEGVTRFSLSVGHDGRPQSCLVTQSSGWPGLDAATCKLVMARARFTPATNEDGRPTTGTYANAIRWVIPR